MPKTKNEEDHGARQKGKKACKEKEVDACPVLASSCLLWAIVFSSMLSGHTSTWLPFRDLKFLAFGLGFQSTTK